MLRSLQLKKTYLRVARRKFSNKSYLQSKKQTSNDMDHIGNLIKIFQKSVESVRPANLLSEAHNYFLHPKKVGENSTIEIEGREWDITDKRCHVVGFGKAVLGMAVQLERALAEHLVSGILSIPIGTLKRFENDADMKLKEKSCIQVYEGALNNLPDEAAHEAAKKIFQLASSMTQQDILFVLISGGGSALLPMPRAPVTLSEKMQLIKQLANKSASIDELNVVRISLSTIKGGRLAAAAHNASDVISLIISDIVGDPVELIASGPTCPASLTLSPALLAKRVSAKDILEKYGIWPTLKQEIITAIEESINEGEPKVEDNGAIYVVGDNRIATATAVREAENYNYNPFIASYTLQDEVKELVLMYRKLLNQICCFKLVDEAELKKNFPFDQRTFKHFFKTLQMCKTMNKPLLLILAGEPTIHVRGDGLGGRNQELAMCMSYEIYQQSKFANVYFLSAGTDGIDGPTPAAGAIAASRVLKDYLKIKNNSLKTFEVLLNNNDSYNFYKNINEGEFHIITGHTGTNVMDLQLLLLTLS